MTGIKICGLRRHEDILFVNELGPEYVGFVIDVPSSPRSIDARHLTGLVQELDDGIVKVGVFVDESLDFVSGLLADGLIDMAQLHGDEPDAYVSELCSVGRPVIKAFRFFDLDRASSCPADYILIDGAVAGSGHTFPWDAVSTVRRPFFLAGGLDSANVGEAVARLRPFAVDVSSSVESGGVKDFSKMAEFIAAVRNAEKVGPRHSIG
ncbi:MAG: phosphoribosylanthranilate isomerase [Sphaerochaetaceae bacterium]